MTGIGWTSQDGMMACWVEAEDYLGLRWFFDAPALAGGLRRVQRVLPERFEHMAAAGGRVTMNELLVLFKDAQDTRELGCTARLFVGHRCARPSPRRAVQPRKVLFC